MLAAEEGAAGEGAGEGATGEGATGEGATGEGATGEGATGEGATGEEAMLGTYFIVSCVYVLLGIFRCFIGLYSLFFCMCF